jgi:hypothetical protein
VIELSHRLAEGIKRNDAKADVKPDSKGWLDPIRLLLDRDGRSVEEVGDVIDWCLADEFNRKTVLSPRALRKRFGELAQKAGVAQPDERPQNGRLAIAFRRGSARDAESLPAFIADATLEDTWAPIAADLREAVDESAFNIWLAPLHLHEAGEELVVGTGQGALSWVRDRFGRVIESCAESVAGKPVRLVSCECERAERAA